MSENVFAVEARPKMGKELPRVNFYQLYEKNIALSKEILNDFSGICQLGADQVYECYSLWNETYNPFDIASMCGKCSYCSDELSNPVITNFRKEVKVNGGEYRHPQFIDKVYNRFIQQTSPASFVYIITDGHYIKIGKTNLTNLNRRNMQLQTGNSQKIFYISLIPCCSEEASSDLEYNLHKTYSQYKVSGEWFNLVDYIDIQEFHEYWKPSLYIDEPKINVWDYCKK